MTLPIVERLRCSHGTGDLHLEAADTIEEIAEALKTATVHLIAAISLLERLHEDLPRSKKHALFNTKLADYSKAVEIGRTALAKVEATGRPSDSDGTRSAETACPAPVPKDCQARCEAIAHNPPSPNIETL